MDSYLDIDDPPQDPVLVPVDALSPETLRAVVEAFVLREGTDYGAREASHEQKVDEVLAGLACGAVRILYDPKTESVTLMPKESVKL
jgi:uncharacterized protein